MPVIERHDDGSETRESTIAQIKWEEDGNSWKILRMSNGECWKGQVGDVLPGTLLRCRGREGNGEYGVFFKIEETGIAIIDTVDGMAAWLTYRLPQVGPERVERLMSLFRDALIHTIEHDPQMLTQVNGITPERAKEISDTFREFKAEQKVVTELINNGLKTELAIKAYKDLNNPYRTLESILETDPYALMSVDGITFAILDPVCLNMGIDKKDPRRIRAYAIFLLREELGKGHCYMDRLELLGHIHKWGFSYREAAEILKGSSRIVLHTNEVMLSGIDRAEQIVSRRVVQMLQHTTPALKDMPDIPNWLDSEQKEAVLGMLTEPISIMTGGPGTGKTTTLLAAMDAMEARGERIKCAAPTGKAAKRMSEVCGREATTIHRLLGWKPEGWDHTATNPLEANVVVIDEASMVDIHLAASLFDAVGNARLVIVGDSDQLPPVGPGQPLHDLLQSKKIPTYQLLTVHRQKGDSWVCDNAPKIINGQYPDLGTTEDFEFGYYEDSEDIIHVAVELFKKYPHIQILSPEKGRGAGTVALNTSIQAAINPRNRFDEYVTANNYHIYEGDRVLYTRNNKNKGLVNGDLGYVKQVTSKGEVSIAVVAFEGIKNPKHPQGWFTLEGADTRDLLLAYALTVHKAQGSEWPFVIVIADETHFFLGRQLLYTAVTRAYERLAIIGSTEAIYRAVKRPRDTNRRTLLQQRLTGNV